MKHRRVISLIALVMLLACLATIPVLAQPPLCQFKGTVTLDLAWVAAGTPIIAMADSTQVGETTAYIEGGVSKYSLFVVKTDSVPAEGDSLEFYVNGYLGGTSTWNAGGTKTLNLAASTGDVPDISVSTTSLAFGSVTVGTSYTKTVTVSNTGTADLTITMSITGTNANQFSVMPTSWTIAPAGSHGLSVTFSPTSTSSKSATLTIASNDPDETYVNVALSGTGTEVAPPTEASFASWLYDKFVECLVD